MFLLFFITCIALSLSLLFYLIKEGKYKNGAKIFRLASIFLAIALFGYYFTEKSLSKFRKDHLSLQLINTLPQPIDFYLIKINDVNGEKVKKVDHLGVIRPDFYRIEYLDMQNSDEFWVAGFLGKKNLEYFSQHAVPNKNNDQIIEVKNYINQSLKLSDEAVSAIDTLRHRNLGTAVWVTFDLLLLFLNIVLLFNKKKEVHAEVVSA